MRKRKLAMLLVNNFKEYCGHHLSCKETEFQQPGITERYLVILVNISTHFDLEIWKDWTQAEDNGRGAAR